MEIDSTKESHSALPVSLLSLSLYPMPSTFPFPALFFQCSTKIPNKNKKLAQHIYVHFNQDIRSDLFTMRNRKRNIGSHSVLANVRTIGNARVLRVREKAWNSTRWKWQHMSWYSLALSPQQCVVTVVWWDLLLNPTPVSSAYRNRYWYSDMSHPIPWAIACVAVLENRVDLLTSQSGIGYGLPLLSPYCHHFGSLSLPGPLKQLPGDKDVLCSWLVMTRPYLTQITSKDVTHWQTPAPLDSAHQLNPLYSCETSCHWNGIPDWSHLSDFL